MNELNRLSLATIRARYQPDYRPICDGCGQPMEGIVYGFSRCRGRVKIGRRWETCPAPRSFEHPPAQARADVLMLIEALESARRWPKINRQTRVVERPRDLFSELEVPA
jgi:hypothetical protein